MPLAAPHEVRVLFVVQPGERNVLDQRGLEYEVAEQSSSVGGAGAVGHGSAGGASSGSQRVLCLRASLADVAARAILVQVTVPLWCTCLRVSMCVCVCFIFLFL